MSEGEGRMSSVRSDGSSIQPSRTMAWGVGNKKRQKNGGDKERHLRSHPHRTRGAKVRAWFGTRCSRLASASLILDALVLFPLKEGGHSFRLREVARPSVTRLPGPRERMAENKGIVLPHPECPLQAGPRVPQILPTARPSARMAGCPC